MRRVWVCVVGVCHYFFLLLLFYLFKGLVSPGDRCCYFLLCQIVRLFNFLLYPVIRAILRHLVSPVFFVLFVASNKTSIDLFLFGINSIYYAFICNSFLKPLSLSVHVLQRLLHFRFVTEEKKRQCLHLVQEIKRKLGSH